MSVKDNLIALKSSLPQGVQLVAVSKTMPASLIMEAYEAGHRDFGENYVQELVQKYEELPKDIRWHFIGHLQSNKVKYIAPFVHLVHGVENKKALAEINRQAQKHNRAIDALLQLRIAVEETKFGMDFDTCRALLADVDVKNYRHVRIKGFMAMASNTNDQEQVKQEFLKVKKFRDGLLPEFPALQVLSYGMSSDFRVAVDAGSSMVRIGSLVFGERNYR